MNFCVMSLRRGRIFPSQLGVPLGGGVVHKVEVARDIPESVPRYPVSYSYIDIGISQCLVSLLVVIK